MICLMSDFVGKTWILIPSVFNLFETLWVEVYKENPALPDTVGKVKGLKNALKGSQDHT